MLKIIPLGIGNAFTKKSFHTSFALYESHKKILMIDCPGNITRVLHENSFRSGLEMDSSTIDNIIITHIHNDHVGGLEEFLLEREYIKGKNYPIDLYTIQENVKPLIHGTLRNFLGYDLTDQKRKEVSQKWFNLVIIDEDKKQKTLVGDIKIKRNRHSIPCFATMVYGTYGGSFGYSGDTEYDTDVIDFLKPATLIAHELGCGFGHTDTSDTIRISSQMAKKTFFVHAPDDLHGRNLHGMKVLKEHGIIFEI